MKSPLRLALLTEIPAPFRLPAFSALAAREDIELGVRFLAANDPRRNYPPFESEWKFDHAVLPGYGVLRGDRWLVLNRGVVGVLRRARPDVVLLGGWNQPAFWQALAYARVRHVPVAVWVESTASDVRSRSWLSAQARRALIGAAAGFVVPGAAARDYLVSLGVEADRITVAPNSVDTGIFRDAVAAARARRGALRTELGFDRPTFLYVGRFHADKGVDLLLRCASEVPEADIVLIGSGPEEHALRELAPDRVRFAGRLERERLVPWLAAADGLVLPSRSEPWGMVLTEAASAGLPLIATEAAGAAHDLIEHGVNGFRVPTAHVGALADALRALATDEGFRTSAGERSLEIARAHTPEVWAAAVAGLARRLAQDRAGIGETPP